MVDSVVRSRQAGPLTSSCFSVSPEAGSLSAVCRSTAKVRYWTRRSSAARRAAAAAFLSSAGALSTSRSWARAWVASSAYGSFAPRTFPASSK